MGVEVLRGRVVSGIGDLSRWMTAYADLYARTTGVRLYPGSLNIVLAEPWFVAHPPLRLEPPDIAVGMNIVPCEIEGVAAFILRTDKNNEGRGDHAPSVIEVAAPVHLRTTLGLEDGDEVEVVVWSSGPVPR